MVFQFQQTLIILTQSIKTFGDVLMSVVFLKILGIQAPERGFWDYQSPESAPDEAEYVNVTLKKGNQLLLTVKK